MTNPSVEERGMKTPVLDNPSTKQGETRTLTESYNQHIRPLLDAVDTLRDLGVMKEGINLPSIVVVGDQSSGKSSVLESLADISLPKGQGICTRVPLIMRLHNCEQKESRIAVDYSGKKQNILESGITETLNSVTEEIAGKGKNIKDTPITLNVWKPNAPDLTMVDLPGITRVPVYGQPQDIYEQVSSIIKRYIAPKESIILNVLSAAVDFSTCESIRMSQQVDEKGERTLAVVTKVDKAPEGVLEKVTDNAVNMRLGYVCVRNRVGNETISVARKKERELFMTDPNLSKIDKNMVGIPVLAEKLMRIQEKSIRKSLPDIIREIDAALSNRQSELNSLPPNVSSNFAEAMTEFTRVVGSIKGMLKKLIVQGDIELFPDEPDMHCIACLRRMFESYSRDLSIAITENRDRFLVEEVKLLDEAQGVSLSNFLPPSVLAILLERRITSVAKKSTDLAIKACQYIDKIVCRVIDMQTQYYPNLHSAARRVFQILIDRKREECICFVRDYLDMQKTIIFTLNPAYLESRRTWEGRKKLFIEAIKKNLVTVKLDGIGDVNLKNVPRGSNQLDAAFDLKTSAMEYWSVVKIRLADEIPLHLRFTFHKMVEDDIENLLVKEVVGSGGPEKIRDILEENPKTATKRRDLLKRIARLRESKSAFSKVVGNVAEMVGKILSGNNAIECFYIETSSFHDFLIFSSLKTCFFFNHTPMELVFIILTCKAEINGFRVCHSLEGGTGFLYGGANCYEKAIVSSAEIKFRRRLPPGDGVLFYHVCLGLMGGFSLQKVDSACIYFRVFLQQAVGKKYFKISLSVDLCMFTYERDYSLVRKPKEEMIPPQSKN